MCREIRIPEKHRDLPGNSSFVLRAHGLEARELDGCMAFFNVEVRVVDDRLSQIIDLAPAEPGKGADVFVLRFPHPYVSAAPGTMLFCRSERLEKLCLEDPTVYCVLVARRGGILYVYAGPPDSQRRLTLRYLGDGLWSLEGENGQALGFREIFGLMMNP